MIFDLLPWSDDKSKITTEGRAESRSTDGKAGGQSRSTGGKAGGHRSRGRGRAGPAPRPAWGWVGTGSALGVSAADLACRTRRIRPAIPASFRRRARSPRPPSIPTTAADSPRPRSAHMSCRIGFPSDARSPSIARLQPRSFRRSHLCQDPLPGSEPCLISGTHFPTSTVA